MTILPLGLRTCCSGDPPRTRCIGRLSARLILAVIPLALLLAGCRSPATTAATGGPLGISASPNPVPAGSETTTITWSTGDKSMGEVYLSRNGGPEKLFAGLSPKGRQDATWIKDGEYEFRLYEGKEHKKVLASVKVTRDAK